MDKFNLLLEMAKTSICPQTLHNLASSSHTNVRRAVARNIHTLSKTLEQLAYDPVLNVSFIATKHPNCDVSREFKNTLNPCVSCKKDERKMVCENCKILQSYYKK